MTLRRWFVMMVAFVVAVAGSAGPARAQAAGVYFNRADNTTVTDPVLNVSVMVCAPSGLIYFTAQHFYSGGGTVLSPSGGSGWMSCDGGLQAQPYDVSMYLVNGVNQLWIDAGDGSSFEQSVGLTITLGTPPPPVEVSTDAVGSQLTPGGIAKRVFRVKNPRTTYAEFSLAVTCSGVVTCTSMTQPTWVPTNAGTTAEVEVSYSVSGSTAAMGNLTLFATDLSDNTNSGNATASVMISPTAPIVNRALCLSMPAGANASYECGSLRVAHALPSVRTIEIDRTPILTYESQQAHPRPIVTLDATVPIGQPQPDSIVTTVTINGFQMKRKVPGIQWLVGQTRRAMVTIDSAKNFATGIYDYSVEVRRFWAETSAVLATATGSLPIVNRTSSPFGAGWWVAGFEELTMLPNNRVLWVGGDGSAKVYEQVGAPIGKVIYMATRQTYSDSLIKNTVDNTWERRLPNGGWVGFNASFKHVKTKNRAGDSTTFTYDVISGRLAQIAVPPTSAGLSYTFSYMAGKLASVTAPDSTTGTYRVTQVTVDPSGRLMQIVDPGLGSAVTFAYSDSFPARMASRTDRRGGITLYRFDSAHRLSSSTVPLASPDSSQAKYCAAESMGMNDCMSTPAAPTDVRTFVDGPRTNVGDTTSIWIDSRGAPTRIRDAAGNDTYVDKGDPRYPALATRTQRPDTGVVSAMYDERGNVRILIDSATSYAGAKVRYEWHPVWNQPTVITFPVGNVIRRAYNDTTGNLVSVEDARGSVSRTTYEYWPSGHPAARQLKATVAPDGTKDSIAYDATRRNAAYYRSATQKWTRFKTDSIGRVRSITSPIGTGAGDTTVIYRAYDRLSRVIAEQQWAPAFGGTSTAQSTTTTTIYDDEGNTTAITRAMNPAGPMSPLTISWIYDIAGRPVRQISSDGKIDSTFYDQAGNATRVRTRRGNQIWSTYDALNRPTLRALSSAADTASWREGASFADSAWSSNPRYGGYAIPADTTWFAYDRMGRIAEAWNRDARVKQRYTRFGKLATDSLWIATWARDSMKAYGTSYDYDQWGRMIRLWYPTQLVLGTNGYAAYSYDATTGFLATVTGLASEAFTFAYNGLNDITQVTMPGSIIQTNTYDADGRVTLHRIENAGGSGPNRFAAQWIDSTRVKYTVRGTIDSTVNKAGPKDIRANTYSGLGHLRRAQYSANGVNIFGNPLSATVDELFGLDPMGNVWETVNSYSVTVGSGGWGASSGLSSAPELSVATYQSNTGRITQRQRLAQSYVEDTETFTYDDAGNTKLSSHLTWNTQLGSFTGQVRVDDRVGYYDASEVLRHSERRDHLKNANGNWGNVNVLQRIRETYRYDPLGRRVLVRTEATCFKRGGIMAGLCNIGYTRRTVWAGSHELMEIQRPVEGIDNKTLAMMESDTGALLLPPRIANLDYRADVDIAQHYGRVAYLHGLEIDRPLSVTRFDYVDRLLSGANTAYAWPRFTFVPHWNVRGEAVTGTLSNGAAKLTAVVSSQTRTVGIPYPIGALAYNRLVPDSLTAWQGTLLAQKQDFVGTMYRRNRYYDPATGRFTQQDPIGLAGGLNLYGYAEGDPINNSDPFGLCPFCPLAYAGAEGGAVVGTAILPGVGTVAGAVVGAAIGIAGGILAGRWLMGRSDNDIPLVGQPPNTTIVKPGQVVRVGPNGNATSRTCAQSGHGCEGAHTHDYVTGPNGKVNQKGKPRPATPEETAEVEATKPPPKPEPEKQR